MEIDTKPITTYTTFLKYSNTEGTEADQLLSFFQFFLTHNFAVVIRTTRMVIFEECIVSST